MKCSQFKHRTNKLFALRNVASRLRSGTAAFENFVITSSPTMHFFVVIDISHSIMHFLILRKKINKTYNTAENYIACKSIKASPSSTFLELTCLTEFLHSRIQEVVKGDCTINVNYC